MAHINFEFKAKANNIEKLEEKLQQLHPVFKGIDRQKDTYYNVAKGRLKLREGTIENALIYYEREDNNASKQSDVILYRHTPDAHLKAILSTVHDVKIIVNKMRKIYFVNNVKIHFDVVERLGTFIEVEAIDEDGNGNIEKLKQQCDEFANFFGVTSGDYIAHSYSDMLIKTS